MVTQMIGWMSSLMLVGVADLDFSGWLVGPEVRSAIANFFASIFTALTSIIFGTLVGGA